MVKKTLKEMAKRMWRDLRVSVRIKGGKSGEMSVVEFLRIYNYLECSMLRSEFLSWRILESQRICIEIYPLIQYNIFEICLYYIPQNMLYTKYILYYIIIYIKNQQRFPKFRQKYVFSVRIEVHVFDNLYCYLASFRSWPSPFLTDKI